MNRQYRSSVTNVLVIGSGAAGLQAAIAAFQAGMDVRSPVGHLLE
ncbi:MAG: FAD-binding protein [Syntrophobacteria bacterium]